MIENLSKEQDIKGGVNESKANKTKCLLGWSN